MRLGKVERDAFSYAALGLQDNFFAQAGVHMDRFREFFLARAVAVNIRMVKKSRAHVQSRLHKPLRLGLVQPFMRMHPTAMTGTCNPIPQLNRSHTVDLPTVLLF
jgi:hypothetical protein